MVGMTNIGKLSLLFPPRLSAARMVPDNSLYGSASVGLIGAGSNAVPHASEISILVAGPRSRMVFPNAINVMLLEMAKSLIRDLK